MPRTSVLLVDINDDFLDGLSAWLSAGGEFEVVGRAHSWSEAIERIERLNPALVVTDVTLPHFNVLEEIRRLKADENAPLVVLMAFHHSRATREEALEAGADAWLSKATITESLLPAVEELLRRRGSAESGTKRKGEILEPSGSHELREPAKSLKS